MIYFKTLHLINGITKILEGKTICLRSYKVKKLGKIIQRSDFCTYLSFSSQVLSFFCSALLEFDLGSEDFKILGHGIRSFRILKSEISLRLIYV